MRYGGSGGIGARFVRHVGICLIASSRSCAANSSCAIAAREQQPESWQGRSAVPVEVGFARRGQQLHLRRRSCAAWIADAKAGIATGQEGRPEERIG